MSTTQIRAEGLSVSFGALRAVNDVTLDIPVGELHGVIGPNGAGKSTFIDALSGRVKPSSGRVYFGGEDITTKGVSWRRVKGLSRSFQRTSIFPTLSVGDQLELVGDKVGETDLAELVEQLELSAFMHRVSGTISYGDQRRVDLALAMLGRPKTLLLDEPAAGLTGAETERMVEHVKELAKHRELTVVLVEHDVPAVFRFADRITVLDRGMILMSGLPAEVRADARVIRAYLGTAA
jgi:branched-chain amino acid transport system ATP-binding protein